MLLYTEWMKIENGRNRTLGEVPFVLCVACSFFFMYRSFLQSMDTINCPVMQLTMSHSITKACLHFQLTYIARGMVALPTLAFVGNDGVLHHCTSNG